MSSGAKNIIAVGNSGNGQKARCAWARPGGLPESLSVGFITASALVHELLEARDDKRLLRFMRQLAAYKLLIIDELRLRSAIADRRRIAVRSLQSKYERGRRSSRVICHSTNDVLCSSRRSFHAALILDRLMRWRRSRKGEGSGSSARSICHGCPLVNGGRIRRPRLRIFEDRLRLNIERGPRRLGSSRFGPASVVDWCLFRDLDGRETPTACAEARRFALERGIRGRR